MDYKKKYEEVLERAKEIIECSKQKDSKEVRMVLSFFPELAESEDERIRKEIKQFIRSRGMSLAQSKVDSWIAWLEKKIEQKEDNPPFNDPKYLVGFDTGREVQKIFDEQKPTKWSEEDIKTIERIVCILDGIRYYNTVDNKQEKPYQSEIDWLKFFKDRVLLQPKQEWKQENTYDLTDFENAMMHIGGSFFGDNAGLDPNDTNAIKEQANILLELVPKQEWSEKDERIKNNLLSELTNLSVRKLIEKETEKKYASWLKSLRHQSQWKPSDAQMEVLMWCKPLFTDPKSKGILESLINDLKNL